MMDKATFERVAMVDRESGSAIAHLARFPEQNPNAVIETDMAGAITYLNPEAIDRFPDLQLQGVHHPLLAGVLAEVEAFRRQNLDFVQREVECGDGVFEQKICYSSVADEEQIRIYSHDVTAHRRAESALAILARRVLDAQEEERKRVARELHDEAGQAMAALKISLELLRDEHDADVLRRNLDRAIDLVDVTREQIRLLAHDLRPPALDTLGLNATLEDFCSQFSEHTRIAIDYRGEPMGDLDDAQEICLYRLLQEALANIAMHAAAEHARVDLWRNGDEVGLSVVDDGRGMDLRVLEDPQRSGLGLVGMRERLEMLGGRLKMASSSAGTTVIATFPVASR